MIVTTMNDIPGYTVDEVFGEVMGLTVRSRNVGSQIGAQLKSILGGELKGMTKALVDSRHEVMERMSQEAEAKGANAIIAMRFDTSEMGRTGPRSAPTAPRSGFTRLNSSQRPQQREELVRASDDDVGRGAQLGRRLVCRDRDPDGELEIVERAECVEIGRVVAGDERAAQTRRRRAVVARPCPCSPRAAAAPRAPCGRSARPGPPRGHELPTLRARPLRPARRRLCGSGTTP